MACTFFAPKGARVPQNGPAISHCSQAAIKLWWNYNLYDSVQQCSNCTFKSRFAEESHGSFCSLTIFIFLKRKYKQQELVSIRSSSSHLWSWYSFHNEFMGSESKSCNNKCFYVKNNVHIRSWFCTCHNSSAVVTCAKLWPDCIIRIKIRTKITCKSFQLWAHNLFVKWSLGVWQLQGRPTPWPENLTQDWTFGQTNGSYRAVLPLPSISQ